jgi:hypothetical protein
MLKIPFLEKNPKVLPKSVWFRHFLKESNVIKFTIFISYFPKISCPFNNPEVKSPPVELETPIPYKPPTNRPIALTGKLGQT